MGLAVTERLIKFGWNVAIVDFNEKSGQEVEQKIGSQLFYIKSNVAVWEQLSSAFVKTWEKWGRLDFGKRLASRIVYMLTTDSICKRGICVLHHRHGLCSS